MTADEKGLKLFHASLDRATLYAKGHARYSCRRERGEAVGKQRAQPLFDLVKIV